jgi:hypothetical protein
MSTAAQDKSFFLAMYARGLREHYGYWGEDPAHSPQQWRRAVNQDETRASYWEWVAAKSEGVKTDPAKTDSNGAKL